jgi:hypothetical protein
MILHCEEKSKREKNGGSDLGISSGTGDQW